MTWHERKLSPPQRDALPPSVSGMTSEPAALPLPISPSLARILILLAPLAVLLLIAATAVQRRWLALQARLPEIVSAVASERLERRVHVGGVTWSPNRIILNDIRIAERHGGQDFASARSVVLNADVRELISPSPSNGPITGSAVVHDARVHIARNAEGEWNFADLIKPRKPEARPFVGRIQLDGVAVDYEDERFPIGAKREPEALRTTLQRVDGVVDLHPDRSVSWNAWVRGSTDLVQQARVTGNYTVKDSRLFLDIHQCRASLAPLLDRYAPQSISFASLDVAGDLTLLYAPKESANSLIYQADAAIEHAAFTSRELQGSIHSLHGRIQVTPDAVRGALTGVWRGQPASVRGVVRRPDRPILDLLVQADSVNVGDILEGLRAPEAITRHMRGVHATADVQAVVRGPLSRPLVEGRMAGRIAGTHVSGLSAPRPASVNAAFSWAPNDLRASAVIAAPALHWKGHSASNLRANVALAGSRLDADVRALYMGAATAARANITLHEGAPGYRVIARTRGLDIAMIPELADYRLQGEASVDLTMESPRLEQTPRGQAVASIANAWIEGLHVGHITANLASDGRRVAVQPFEVFGPPGRAIVAGTVDLADRTLDLTAEASQMNLALLLRDYVDGRVGGTAYANALHISGPIEEPRIAGQVQVYGPYFNDYSSEYAQLTVEGDRRTLKILDGELWRLPGILTLQGVLWQPLREDGLIHLEGEIAHAELQDLVRLAGLQEPITGQASGAFEVSGAIRRPEVVAPSIVIARGGYGDFPLEHIEASALLTPDRSFLLEAKARGLDLALLDPLLGEAASLTGTLEVGARVQGSLADGVPERLAGSVEAATDGLTVNGQTVGDLRASIQLLDGLLAASMQKDGSPPVRLEGADLRAGISDLNYDFETGQVRLNASFAQVPVSVLRALAVRSPWFLAHPDELPSWLQPVMNAVEGELSGTVEVTGPIDDAQLALRLSAEGARVLGMVNTEVRGDIAIRKSTAALNTFRIANGTALIEADGKLAEDGTLSGRLTARRLPIALTESLFPDRPELLGWNGELSALRAELSGTRERPIVTGAATVERVFKAGATGPRPPVHIRRLDVAAMHVQEGEARAEGVTVEFERLEPGALPRAAAGEDTFRASGSAAIGFGWSAPFVRMDSPAALSLTLPEQSLDILKALAPGAPIKSDGRIAAALSFTGTLAELGDPQRALVAEAPSVKLKGDLRITANSIRVADARTILQDVNLHLVLDGDRLKVLPTSATGQHTVASTAVLGPRGEVLPNSVFPLTLSGELPIREGVEISEPLTLSAQKLAFAEAPLPLVGSGRVAGVLAGPTPPPGGTQAPGVQLVVERSLLTPRISGTIYIRDTDLRAPDATQPFDVTARESVVRPSFNVRVHVGEKVRVSAPAVTALVKSPPTRPILLQGTLGQMKLGGELQVQSGYIAFPTARFAIQPGGSISLIYPRYVGAGSEESTFGVYVDMAAVGRLTASSITGAMRRYQVTAEVRGMLGAESPLFLEETTSGPRVGGGQGLQITFRSSPPDLALSQAGLQRKITGILGGEEAIASLFRSDAHAVRALGAQALDAVSASLLPDLFERTGLGRALGFDEFLVDYNRLEAFTFRVSRRIAGPLDIAYWHRLGGPAGGLASERSAWELRTGLRLNRTLRFSWSLDNQGTNGYLLEGVMRF